MKALPVYKGGNPNFLIKLKSEQMFCTYLLFVMGDAVIINPKPNIHPLGPDSKLGFPFVNNPIFILHGSLMIFVICVYTEECSSVYKTADGRCLAELS